MCIYIYHWSSIYIYITVINIYVDIIGGNYSSLIMAVRNKLYGLLSVVMILAADTLPQAIHIAVSQGILYINSCE